MAAHRLAAAGALELMAWPKRGIPRRLVDWQRLRLPQAVVAPQECQRDRSTGDQRVGRLELREAARAAAVTDEAGAGELAVADCVAERFDLAEGVAARAVDVQVEAEGGDRGEGRDGEGMKQRSCPLQKPLTNWAAGPSTRRPRICE